MLTRQVKVQISKNTYNTDTSKLESQLCWEVNNFYIYTFPHRTRPFQFPTENGRT